MAAVLYRVIMTKHWVKVNVIRLFRLSRWFLASVRMRMFLARTTLRTVWQGCPFPLVLRRSKSNMNGLPKSEGEWRTVLSPQQFRVLRQKGTEMPGTGKYNKLFDPGVYHCGACNVPLYKSTTKFDSGCGWPAFFDAIPGAIDRHDDTSHGMVRICSTHNSVGLRLLATTVDRI